MSGSSLTSGVRYAGTSVVLPRPILPADLMPVYYVLDLPCEPKRRFGAEGLLEQLRRVEAVRSVSAPGPEMRGAARQASFELRPVAFHCAKCPANYARADFGCFGVVRLPVSAEAEEWLASLLPATLKPGKLDEEQRKQVEATTRLVERLNALGVDGSAVERRRAEGKLVERERAVARRYGGLFRKIRISTSQLLQVLLCGERTDPALGELLCRALGVWVDGETGADGVPEAVFTQPPDPDDDRATDDLKNLLYALMIACSLDVSIRTQAG